MKRAVILHGTNSAPDQNWFPWMKAKLEAAGYEVWVPDLPNNDTPNAKAYNDLLLKGDWDFTDNIVIGHSSGAVSVLNLLTDPRCPHIKLGVMLGAWHEPKDPYISYEQFKDLLPHGGFDFKTIQSKADELVYMHGDNDPYCPLEQAKWLARQTNSELVIVPNGHHLGSKFTELPALAELLEKHTIL